MKHSKLDLATLQALYDEWTRSDETQRVFLKRKGLPVSVFRGNYRFIQGRKFQKQPARPQLLPVHVVREATPAVSHEVSKLLLHFANGASLQFTTDVSAQYIGSLLSIMESRPAC